PPLTTHMPYTTLFRPLRSPVQQRDYEGRFPPVLLAGIGQTLNALNICRIDRSSGDSFSNYAIKHIGIMQAVPQATLFAAIKFLRSEEHTSELQSRETV